MGLLGGFGTARAQHEVDSLRVRQAQQMAEMQNLANLWQTGAIGLGSSLGLATGTSNAAQSYVYDYSTHELKEAKKKAEPVPAKPKPGTYRRGKVPAGELLYSDSPLAWLDERVDEMRLVL